MEPEIALVPDIAGKVAPIIDSIVTDAQEPLEKSQDMEDADLLTSLIELTIAETVPTSLIKLMIAETVPMTTEIVPETISEVLPVPTIASDDVKVNETPRGDVEESKDEHNNVPVDNTADGETNDMEEDNLEILKERRLGAAAESTYKENRSGGRGCGKRSSVNAGKKTQAQVSKPVPGSWASLVAGGSGGKLTDLLTSSIELTIAETAPTSLIELTIAETVPTTTEIVPETISEVLPVPTIPSDDVKVDKAPKGGVEESKDEQNNVPVDNTANRETNDMEGDNLEILKERGLGADAESTYKENPRGGRGRGGRSSGNAKKKAQVLKPVPGYWASLVAGGGEGGSTPSAVK